MEREGKKGPNWKNNIKKVARLRIYEIREYFNFSIFYLTDSEYNKIVIVTIKMYMFDAPPVHLARVTVRDMYKNADYNIQTAIQGADEPATKF